MLSERQVRCLWGMYRPSVWAGEPSSTFPASWMHMVAFFPPIRDAARPGRPRCESNSSSWGWAMRQRGSVPEPGPLVLSSASSPPSRSAVSARCFCAQPASTHPRRLAHSSPKSPLSHGIDVSRAPAVKQRRLRLGERPCLPGQVSNAPRQAGTGTLHQPCTWTQDAT